MTPARYQFGNTQGRGSSGSEFFPALSESASAATNTLNIQNAINAAINARGGVVYITNPGNYDIEVTGNSPYESGTQYCLIITGDGVVIHVGIGVTLRLAANEQTDAGGRVYMFVGKDRGDVHFEGVGTLDMNNSNQSGWTGGYAQQQGGHIRFYSSTAGGGCHDMTVRDLTFLNTFGNPCDLGTVGAANDAINSRIYVYDCKARVFGEGFQLVGVKNFGMSGCTADDTGGTSRGDFFEVANCLDGTIFANRVYGNLSNGLSGSAVDLFGSKRVAVDGNQVYRAPAVDMANGLGGSVADLITFTANLFSECPSGGSLGNGRYLFSGNLWSNISLSGACLQSTSTTSGARAIFNGDVFEGCYENYHYGTMRVSYFGCSFQNGPSSAIQLVRNGSSSIVNCDLIGCNINGFVGAAVVANGAGQAYSPILISRNNDLRNNTVGDYFGYDGGLTTSFITSDNLP